MISYNSNLNLSVATIIFNKYISYLLNELDLNNELIQSEIDKITLLDLPPIDNDYIINSFEQMKLANDTYSSLLLTFQKAHADFESKKLRPIPFYSSHNLDDIFLTHLKSIS